MGTYKVCPKCGRQLSVKEFGYSKANPDGYTTLCNDCRVEKAKRLKERQQARRVVRFWECDIIARPEHRESKK